MMEGTTAFAAFSAVLAASTANLAEKGFEICALDEKANGLLQMVQQVSTQLDDARALVGQKSDLVHDLERRLFEDTFKHTEDAICHVAALAERPRADVEVTGGRVRANTRVLFVLRDSPHIQVSFSQLQGASQELTSTIAQLSGRRRQQFTMSGHAPPHDSPPVQEGDMSPPPTYEDSVRNFMMEGRRRNMARRRSAMALASAATSSQHERVRSSSSLSAPIRPVMAIPELDIPELAADESQRPMSLPIPLTNDLRGSPSQQRPASYRLSPDMSIPEVMPSVDESRRLDVDISPKSSQSRQSSVDLHNDNMDKSSTPLDRRMGGGRKTGRARTQSWLEARALG